MTIRSKYPLLCAAALFAALSAVATAQKPGERRVEATVVYENDGSPPDPSAPPGPDQGTIRRLRKPVQERYVPVPAPGEPGFFGAENPGTRRPMLVLSSEPEARTTVEIQEDLAVMSRILNKTVREAADSREWNVLGIKVLTLSHGFSRDLYIEDYGVVFNLRVGIPLQPGPKEKKPGDDEESETNSVWEEARNELFGGRSFRQPKDRIREVAYDAGAVEELKTSLIRALRNATNIRHLKPEDWITIVVNGQGAPAARVDFDWGFRLQHGIDVMMAPGEENDAPASTMVLRVRKSHVDEFARSDGDDLERFREKVSISIY